MNTYRLLIMDGDRVLVDPDYQVLGQSEATVIYAIRPKYLIRFDGGEECTVHGDALTLLHAKKTNDATRDAG